LHAVAVVAAILPNLAQWAHGLIDNALNAAGTSASEVGMEALNGAGVVYEGLKTLGEGAVLSFVGLIHAPEVAWAANPPVALGYLFFGLVCALYWLLPGAKDPVAVDEADVVAGH
jgi:AGZA family xanthine/uracil permease-like MFS transporter